MKVYVKTKDIDVINDLFEATSSYECWACNRDDDLEIVSLSDHDNQIRTNERKKVVAEIKTNSVKDNDDFGNIFYNVNEKLLDQIQGETK